MNDIHRSVQQAYTRDVGNNLIRIDYKSMNILNVKTGDMVKLMNKNKLLSLKVVPLYPSDENQGIIRIDEKSRLKLNVIENQQILITSPKTVEQEDQELLLNELELQIKYIVNFINDFNCGCMSGNNKDQENIKNVRELIKKLRKYI